LDQNLQINQRQAKKKKSSTNKDILHLAESAVQLIVDDFRVFLLRAESNQVSAIQGVPTLNSRSALLVHARCGRLVSRTEQREFSSKSAANGSSVSSRLSEDRSDRSPLSRSSSRAKDAARWSEQFFMSQARTSLHEIKSVG
jgi:hypothetical protein